MSQGANLKDTGVLDKINSNLLRNSEEIGEALRIALIVFNKELENLEGIKRKKIILVENCDNNLRSAQRNLKRCIDSSQEKNNRNSCFQQEQLVIIARRNLNRAQEELKRVLRWKIRLNEVINKYKNTSKKLQTVIENETPKARAVIHAKKRAIQAYLDSVSYYNPSQKGSDFETWARDYYFHGRGEKTKVNLILNLHLDKFGDGVGLTKDRSPDVFVNENGELWDMKAGYENGKIDQDQLREYRIMLDAGMIKEYKKDTDEIVEIPVNSINYLFETRKGAENNRDVIDSDVLIWFVDENGNPELLS